MVDYVSRIVVSLLTPENRSTQSSINRFLGCSPGVDAQATGINE